METDFRTQLRTDRVLQAEVAVIATMLVVVLATYVYGWLR